MRSAGRGSRWRDASRCVCTVRRDLRIVNPVVETPDVVATIASAPTLDEAAALATRDMADLLDGAARRHPCRRDHADERRRRPRGVAGRRPAQDGALRAAEGRARAVRASLGVSGDAARRRCTAGEHGGEQGGSVVTRPTERRGWWARLRRVIVRRPDEAMAAADPARWHYAAPIDLGEARAAHDDARRRPARLGRRGPLPRRTAPRARRRRLRVRPGAGHRRGGAAAQHGQAACAAARRTRSAAVSSAAACRCSDASRARAASRAATPCGSTTTRSPWGAAFAPTPRACVSSGRCCRRSGSTSSTTICPASPGRTRAFTC